MEKAQRYRAAVGGDATPWAIVVPDDKGCLVYHSAHAAIVAELVGLLGEYRIGRNHSSCRAGLIYNLDGGPTCHYDDRCDLCKRTDTALELYK